MLQLIPGPPFVFGALLVILALIVAAFIPDNQNSAIGSWPPPHHSDSSPSPVLQASKSSDAFHFEIIHKRIDGSQPLMQDTEPL